MLDQEVLEEIRGRSAIYYVLSKCFTRPDNKIQDLASALTSIMEVFELETGFEKNQIEKSEMELEYNRLFVGPGRLPCPPYESVLRKDRPEHETGLVMGPSTRDVIRRYEEAGFSVDSGFNDLPDHIQVELEFLHLLCEKELESPGEAELWRSRYDEFVKQHLLPWIPSFTDSVEQKSRSPFYRSAARLLRELVNKETLPGETAG